MSATQTLKDIVTRNLEGQAAGIYSVCSANQFVLEAAMITAKQHGSSLLIEATCNQVNQDGGYTGMTPADFVQYVKGIAVAVGFDTSKLILGGDHLGPNPWTHLTSEDAMQKAAALVQSYVEAGFTKIHLDASMACADDVEPLDPQVIAERAAKMCQVAESVTVTEKPCYIIGTEVPVPGGAQEDLEELSVTTTEDLGQTINTHVELFKSLGIAEALDRVIGVVVQPGVEFDHASVIEYNREKATRLKQAIHTYQGIVYEAHSTDYQTQQSLTELVEDHFAILKVGPGLTYAFREAVFALSHIEDEWVDASQRSNIREVLDNVMLEKPKYWQSYYHGSTEEKAFARKFSFSDRSRYYWNDPMIDMSLQTLISNLEKRAIPLPLISQYFPALYGRVRAGEVSSDPVSLIHHHIGLELDKYAIACHQFATSN
jgi:D-tagatose-1,6-bisphosphate aldolase subunit GatZ/KbaZ